jgi:predicted RNase H-like nuclease (RuvC/YqgF family)
MPIPPVNSRKGVVMAHDAVSGNEEIYRLRKRITELENINEEYFKRIAELHRREDVGMEDLRNYMVKCSEYRRRIIELEAQFKEDQYERDKLKILKFDLKEIAGGLLEAKLKERDQLDQLRKSLEKIIVV